MACLQSTWETFVGPLVTLVDPSQAWHWAHWWQGILFVGSLELLRKTIPNGLGHGWACQIQWAHLDTQGGMLQHSPTPSRWLTTSLPSDGNLWMWSIRTSRRRDWMVDTQNRPVVSRGEATPRDTVHSVASFCFLKKVRFSFPSAHSMKLSQVFVAETWMELSGHGVDTFWPGRKVSRLPWGGDPRCSSNGCVNPALEGARQRALCEKGVLQTDRWPNRCWELNLRHSYLEDLGGSFTEELVNSKYVLCGYDPSISCRWILPIHSLWSAIEDTSLESSATLATQSHSALLAGTHLTTCCLYLAISGYIHLLVSSCASKLDSENLEWGFHHSMFPTNENQFTDTAGYQMVIFLPGEASWLGWGDQNPGSISYTTSGARPGGLLGLEWGCLCCPKRLWSLTTSCYKTQELEGIADHSVPRVGSWKVL